MTKSRLGSKQVISFLSIFDYRGYGKEGHETLGEEIDQKHLKISVTTAIVQKAPC